MKKKAKYLIHDWSRYNALLKKRESGAIYVSSQAVENWTTDELTGQPGASPAYIDQSIIQAICGLGGRQTQSFIQSVFELTPLDLPLHDHSTLSRQRPQ
jgi:hypothetical protein